MKRVILRGLRETELASAYASDTVVIGGQGRNRTSDTRIFSLFSRSSITIPNRLTVAAFPHVPYDGERSKRSKAVHTGALETGNSTGTGSGRSWRNGERGGGGHG